MTGIFLRVIHHKYGRLTDMNLIGTSNVLEDEGYKQLTNVGIISLIKNKYSCPTFNRARFLILR
jgi:hypothetical protein